MGDIDFQVISEQKLLPLQPDFIYLFIAHWTLAIVAVTVNWHVYYLHQYHKSVVEKACHIRLHTPMWNGILSIPSCAKFKATA